jgi:hypothetical protein
MTSGRFYRTYEEFVDVGQVVPGGTTCPQNERNCRNSADSGVVMKLLTQLSVRLRISDCLLFFRFRFDLDSNFVFVCFGFG